MYENKLKIVGMLTSVVVVEFVLNFVAVISNFFRDFIYVRTKVIDEQNA